MDVSSLLDQRILIYDPVASDADAGGAGGTSYALRRNDLAADFSWAASVGYREGRDTESGLRLTSVTEATIGVRKEVTLTPSNLLRHLYEGEGALFNVASVRPAVGAAMRLATATTSPLASYSITDDVPAFTVAAVAVTPSNYTGDVGDTAAFAAVVTSETGTTLTDRVAAWATSDDTVVFMRADGVAEFVAPGVATVTATVDGVSGTATVGVV